MMFKLRNEWIQTYIHFFYNRTVHLDTVKVLLPTNEQNS
jgi:hypothetical protein